MSDKFTEFILIDQPKVLTTVKCAFKSHKIKERPACYFGPVTFTNSYGENKILRDECYLLIQDSNLHKNKGRKFVEIPRND
jgi:hypothetical protein